MKICALLAGVACLALATGSRAQDGVDFRVNPDPTGVQAETSIAVNPLDPDNWVVLAIDDRPGVKIAWFTTLDGGQTWSEGFLPTTATDSGAVDPLVAFAPDGSVHAISLTPLDRAIIASHSTDGGLTWSPAVILDQTSGSDKTQFAIDQSRGPRRGEMAAIWARNSARQIMVSTSADNGLTWSPPQAIVDVPGPYVTSDIAYGPQGEIYALFVDVQDPQTVMLDCSRDGGATWGTDILVVQGPKLSSSAYTFLPLPVFNVAVDYTNGPYSGRVYVLYHEWDAATQKGVLRCATSSNQGVSWTRNFSFPGQ